MYRKFGELVFTTCSHTDKPTEKHHQNTLLPYQDGVITQSPKTVIRKYGTNSKSVTSGLSHGLSFTASQVYEVDLTHCCMVMAFTINHLRLIQHITANNHMLL